MLNLMLLVMACCSPQPDDGAAALLKEAQARLLRVKVLDIRFEGVQEIEGEKYSKKLSGSLSLSLKDPKLAAQLNVDKDAPYKKSISGDSARLTVTEALESVALAGAFVPLFLLESFAEDVKKQGPFFTDPKQLDCSPPKLGNKEKLGERLAQVVEFTLKSNNGNLVINNKVWIDTERKVPLQWSVNASRGKWRISVVEKFEKVQLDN